MQGLVEAAAGVGRCCGRIARWGESMGPLTPAMKDELIAQQGDLKYAVEWTTLGEYLEALERKGISLNAASSLIYVPGTFAGTDELVALAETAGRCGGIYATHMRGEGAKLLESIDETIEISRRSGAPVEIYHLKAAGRENWPRMEEAIARIEAARESGLRVTADMYSYPAGSTGLDAAMPPWVQEGGNAAWFARLRDPAIRARVAKEMRSDDADWENLMRMAGGADHVLVAVLRNPALKPLIGKTIAEIAAARGVSPEIAAMDLVVEDESRVGSIYFLMSEDEVRRKVALPFMSFGSDGTAVSAEGVFLKSNLHPRGYGNFARVLARYVREEKIVPLEDAVRRLTAHPAGVLGLRQRGRLIAGHYADIVVFDPATIRDHATCVEPHQYATGVSHVIVNGEIALADGEPTEARPGRFVRGLGWTGWTGGGCRRSAADWERP